MKLLLYADAHISLSSSIMRGKSNTLSDRLSNIIKTFDWIDELVRHYNIDQVIDLGDLTDKDHLSSEEITALGRCKNLASHIHILGNHSTSSADGEYNAINIFPNVVTRPRTIYDERGNSILLLPYSHQTIDLSTYMLSNKSSIILSHNDLKQVRYGNKISTTGYDTRDILDNCALFVNGHIHSSSWVVPNRICNLGVVTGINFSGVELSQWDPSVAIIDTNNPNEVVFIPNPYAIIFRKYKINQIFELSEELSKLDSSHDYAIQVKSPYKLVSDVKSVLSSNPNVSYYRVLPEFDKSLNIDNQLSDDNNSSSDSLFKSKVSEWDKLRSYVGSKSKISADKSIVLNVISQLESDTYGGV